MANRCIIVHSAAVEHASAERSAVAAISKLRAPRRRGLFPRPSVDTRALADPVEVVDGIVWADYALENTDFGTDYVVVMGQDFYQLYENDVSQLAADARLFAVGMGPKLVPPLGELPHRDFLLRAVVNLFCPRGNQTIDRHVRENCVVWELRKI